METQETVNNKLTTGQMSEYQWYLETIDTIIEIQNGIELIKERYKEDNEKTACLNDIILELEAAMDMMGSTDEETLE